MGSEIQSILKAIQILTVFNEKNIEYGVHELSRKIGMHKSTVHRIMMTLEKGGLLNKNNESGKYSLGYKLYELGNLVLPARELKQKSESFMDELTSKTKENANLVVYDRGKALYINRRKGPHKLQLVEEEGGRLPLYCTAVGKIILANMTPEELDRYVESEALSKLTQFTITDPNVLKAECEKIRETGVAIDNQELELGCRCIASPVRDSTGSIIAAIAISGSSARITRRKINPFGQIVAKVAEDFSRELGYNE